MGRCGVGAGKWCKDNVALVCACLGWWVRLRGGGDMNPKMGAECVGWPWWWWERIARPDQLVRRVALAGAMGNANNMHGRRCISGAILSI